MQTANIMVALGGDRTNTVPREKVTVAEIAVLGHIHGRDAIFDVEPLGEEEVDNREELARIKHTYGGARDNDGRSMVEQVYPGAAARLFERLKDLGLDESQFKALKRATVNDEVDETPLEPLKPLKKKAKADDILD